MAAYGLHGLWMHKGRGNGASSFGARKVQVHMDLLYCFSEAFMVFLGRGREVWMGMGMLGMGTGMGMGMGCMVLGYDKGRYHEVWYISQHTDFTDHGCLRQEGIAASSFGAGKTSGGYGIITLHCTSKIPRSSPSVLVLQTESTTRVYLSHFFPAQSHTIPPLPLPYTPSTTTSPPSIPTKPPQPYPLLVDRLIHPYPKPSPSPCSIYSRDLRPQDYLLLYEMSRC